MALEESKEIWTRIDLFCDGIGDDGTCVTEDGCNSEEEILANMPMVTDCCPKAEDARCLTLHQATRDGWEFNLSLKRWLCPACVAALRLQAA